MSWWENEKGSAIGDQPADALSVALTRLTRAQEERGQAKPSLQDILDGLALLLRSGGVPLAGPPLARITASTTLKNGAVHNISGDSGRTVDSTLLDGLRGAIEDVARTYEERWGRRPSPQELLDVLAFVLRYRPEDFLSGAAGLSVHRITSETG